MPPRARNAPAPSAARSGRPARGTGRCRRRTRGCGRGQDAWPAGRAFAFAVLVLALCCAAPGRAAQAADAPATPAPVSVPDEAAAVQAALAQAEYLIVAGEPVAAFAVLMQAMEALPEGADDADLRFGIAQALLAGGRFAQAERVLARIAEERPDNLRVRLDRAWALFALGRDSEARAMFRDALRQPDLPADVRRRVEGFLADILARQRQRADPGSDAPSGAVDHAAVIDTALAEAEYLIAAGEPAMALAVLMQTMEALPEGADDADLRFGIAQALLADGRLEQAERVLARLAEEWPDNLRIRLDHASALFALGRDDEARALFREARRRPDLPDDARRQVEGVLARILDRQRLRVDLDLGLWYDGNVNNTAEVDTVRFPAFGNLVFDVDQRPVGAWVARTGASLHWRDAVTADGRVSVEANASVARNTALGATEYNRTWLTLSAGPRIDYAVPLAGRLRPGRFSANVGVERRLQGGDGHATNLWGELGFDQTLDPDWRVGVAPRLWITRHDGQPGEVDPAGRSLSLSVSRRAGPGWLTLGGTFARETADRSSLNWRSRGLSLTYAADFGEDWSGSVRLGLNAARFDEADAAFLRHREDRTRSAGLTLSHRKVSWEGYQPFLMLDWSRTDSTIPLYDRKPLQFRLGLRRLF